MVNCPRCGFPATSGEPFCARCGRYLAPLVWEAVSPVAPELPPLPRPRYAGPPRYRFVPRWGFPATPWVPPPAPPVTDPLVAARIVQPVPPLWATASVALVAAGAEIWRYVLLLASRTDALDAGAVRASDALVTVAGTVAPVVALLAGALMIRWTVLVSRAAGNRAGVRPARSGRMIVLGWIVPGVNLAVPGATLAEIEHSALGRPPGERPRPSRLLLAWWGQWAAGVVLGAVVLLWSLRTGVQARADGVLLHALADLLAATTAITTARVVGYLTRLLAPVRAVRREVLVTVA